MKVLKMGNGKNKTTSVPLTIKGKEQEPKVVTVNDKAATRQAIINYLEERLPIISRNKFLERSDWHAKPPKGQLEEDWNYFGIVFHHQGNSPQHSCAAMYGSMKEVQDMHLSKYDDIGYHYAVSCTGEVAEGRDIRFKGSHVKNRNTGLIGILLLGDYTEPGEAGIEDSWDILYYNRKVPETQWRSAVVLAHALTTYFNIKKLGGHREFALSSDDRTCPGNIAMPLIQTLRSSMGLGAP